MAVAKANPGFEGPKTRQLRATSAAARREIDMKEAVQAAIGFVNEYFSGAKEILLEEISLEQGQFVANAPGGTPGSPTFKKEPQWRVVVSFRLGEPGTLAEVMGGDPRLYREVYIDPKSGSLRSMRSWGR